MKLIIQLFRRAKLFQRIETHVWFALGITLIYSGVMAISLWHHEMWRDELHCWMVGRNAHGIREILTGERIYDGHPFLWYYLLHLLSRVWDNVLMLKVLTFTISVSTAYIWLKYMPLPRLWRVAFLASYYLIYEYSVLARSYGLTLLFLVLLLVLYDPRRVRLWLLSILLSLLATTSLYGVILATSLAIPVFFSGVHVHAHASPRYHMLFFPRHVYAASALLAGSILFVYFTTLTPTDGWFGKNWNTTVDSQVIATAFLRFTKGMLPIPNWNLFEHWNSYWYAQDPAFLPWIARGGMILFVVSLAVFFVSPRVAIAFVVGTGLMMFIQQAKYEGYTRHFGHFFLLFLACIGLLFKQYPPRRLIGAQVLLLVVLVPGIIGGAIAVKLGWQRPFSSSHMTANFIQSKGLEERPIIGLGDHPVSGVSAYLKSEIYYLDTHEWGQSVTFHNRRFSNPAGDLFEVVRSLIKKTGKVPIIVSNVDCCENRSPDYSILEIFRAPSTVVPDERLRVYDVRTTLLQANLSKNSDRQNHE